jgi:hypothetical protein
MQGQLYFYIISFVAIFYFEVHIYRCGAKMNKFKVQILRCSKTEQILTTGKFAMTPSRQKKVGLQCIPILVGSQSNAIGKGIHMLPS